MKKIQWLAMIVSGVLISVGATRAADEFVHKTGSGMDLTVLGASSTFRLSGDVISAVGDEISISAPQGLYAHQEKLFFHRVISRNAASFIVKIDISGLQDVTSGIGLMAHSSLFEMGGYCKLTVQGNGAVVYECREMGGGAVTKITLAQLKVDQKQLYLRMNMVEGKVSFDCTHPGYSNAEIESGRGVQWMPLTSGFLLPSTHFYGFVLDPGLNTLANVGKFSQFNISQIDEASMGLARRSWLKALWTAALFVVCPVTASTVGVTATTAAVTTVAAGIGVAAAVATTITATAIPVVGVAVPVATTVGVTAGATYTLYSTLNATNRILEEYFNTNLFEVLETIDPLYEEYTYSDPMRSYMLVKQTALTTPPASLVQLKNAYVQSGNKFYSQKLNSLFSVAQNLAQQGAPYTASEISAATLESDKYNMTVHNLEVYLSDALVVYVKGGTRKYSASNYVLYLDHQNYGVLNDLLSEIGYCTNAGSYDLLDVIDPVQKFAELYQCASSTEALVQSCGEAFSRNALGDKDEAIQASARVALHVAMLCMLDNTFDVVQSSRIRSFMMKSAIYALRVRGLYENNNIPMKVLAGVSLYYLSHEGTYTYDVLREMFEEKCLATGEYAEGTQYLRWISKELLPMYYLGMRNGWISTPCPRIAASGNWLLSVADPNGIIPALDDGNPSSAWLAPYGYLNNDKAFISYQENVPYYEGVSSSKPQPALMSATSDITTLLMTYPPEQSLAGATFTSQSGVVNDGMAKLNVAENGYVSSLAMITDVGSQKTNGGSHDQEDAGSISLTRSTGFADADKLIIDPGYGGFGNYKISTEQKQFCFHNTPQVDAYNYGGISINPPVKLGTLLNGVESALDLSQGSIADALATLKKDFCMRSMFRTAAATPLCVGHDGVVDVELPGYGFNGAGGGVAALLPSKAHSAALRISYDYENAYTDREVVAGTNEYFVIDEFHTTQPRVSSVFNLPQGASVLSALGSNYLYGVSGQSSIRVSSFSSSGTVVATVVNAAKQYLTQDPNGAPLITSLTRASSTNSAGENCVMVSVLEPGMGSRSSTLEPYIQVSVPGTSVALKQESSATGTVRYFLRNARANGSHSTMTVNNFSTDAQWTLVEFNSALNCIKSIRALDGTVATYGGKVISGDFSGGELALSEEIRKPNLSPAIDLLLQ